MLTEQDVVKDDKGNHTTKHKSQIKTKLNDEWDAELIATNKQHELYFTWKPTDMNKGDQKVEVLVGGECQPMKDQWRPRHHSTAPHSLQASSQPKSQ